MQFISLLTGARSMMLAGLLALSSLVAQAGLTTDLQALNSQSVTLKTYLANTNFTAADSCARLAEADRMARRILDGISTINQGLTAPVHLDTTMLNELDTLSGNTVNLSTELNGLSSKLNTYAATAGVSAFSIKEGISAMLQLSDDIGTMADRIGDMADKILIMSDNIGLMADRIITTQQLQSQNVALTTNSILTTQTNALQLVKVIEDTSYNVSLDSLVTNGTALAGKLSAVVLTSKSMNTQLATSANDVRTYLGQVNTLASTIETDGAKATAYQTALALQKLTNTAAVLGGIKTALDGYVIAINGLQAVTSSTTLSASIKSMLQMSADIGSMSNRILEMADQILAMADNIGMQADQILATQSAMNGSVASAQLSVLNAQTAMINLIVLRKL